MYLDDAKRILVAVEAFMLTVLGKNGVVVDGKLVEPGHDPVALHSQTKLQIGSELAFYFLLPKKLSKVFRSVHKRKRCVVIHS